MPPKRKLKEDIRAEQVCDYLVTNDRIFDKNCQDLFDTFQNKESYKYLKNIGLQQISSATEWTSTPYEEVQKKARMHYDRIRQVTSTLEDEFDEIIKEKLNGAFRATVKEEILKFIHNQSSLANEENYDIVDAINGLDREIKKEIESDNEYEITEKRKSNGVQQSDMVWEEISLSSVHTSDLSSFDDEISISSEEGNEKRRVSIKFAEEEIKRVKGNMLLEHHNQDKKKRTESSTAIGFQSRDQSPDSTSVPEASSPRRVRKPNSKYFSNEVLSPFDIDLDNTATASTSIHTTIKSNPAAAIARKRGRPRKYSYD